MQPIEPPASRHVAAVQRAIAVLDVLYEAGELGTNEIGRRAGLNPSTASRQLATLAAAGLVAHVAETGQYRLGPRLVELGNAALAGLDLRDLARPRLKALAQETGETATLSVPGDPDAITADFVQSPSSVQSVARLGRPSVAHATATGKVVLAFSGRALPGGELEAFTDRTIVDPERLRQEVERVRQRGWAVAVGEREPDLSAVAAPVLDGRGELVAIVGVQGPAARLAGDRLQAAAGLVARAARSVSDALSGR